MSRLSRVVSLALFATCGWAQQSVAKLVELVRDDTTPAQARCAALAELQDRGELFVGAQVDVYVGMIIGLHAKDTDLDVNPVREKKLTNVRAAGSDDALKLTPPRQLTLEQSMDFLADDEILEVTPTSLRLRKKKLNPSDRKRKAG